MGDQTRNSCFLTLACFGFDCFKDKVVLSKEDGILQSAKINTIVVFLYHCKHIVYLQDINTTNKLFKPFWKLTGRLFCLVKMQFVCCKILSLGLQLQAARVFANNPGIQFLSTGSCIWVYGVVTIKLWVGIMIEHGQ